MSTGTRAWTFPTMFLTTGPGWTSCTPSTPSWQVKFNKLPASAFPASKTISWRGLGCAPPPASPSARVPAGYSPESQQDSINCTSKEYFFQEKFTAPNHTKFSCKFTADMLQNCSGLVDPNFGFAEGRPCFVIKMNRVSPEGPCGDGRGMEAGGLALT